MNCSELVAHACEKVGGQAELARRLGITAPAVQQWRTGERPVPVQHCAAIERATEGAVRRWDLRPTDWWLIWPELVGTPGAPEAPTREAA